MKHPDPRQQIIDAHNFIVDRGANRGAAGGINPPGDDGFPITPSGVIDVTKRVLGCRQVIG